MSDLSDAAREQRKMMLELSDSHVWPDYVTDEWRTFRQALRDVPQQAGFPENITWPVWPE